MPPYANAGSGEAATIEYAVAVLGVQDIIVCGHSHCGAMGALARAASRWPTCPSVRSWLGHAEATSRIIKENYGHITDPQAQAHRDGRRERAGAAREPAHASQRAGGDGAKELRLHGWVYKFETGQVFAFDPQIGQFESVGEQGLRAAAGDAASAGDLSRHCEFDHEPGALASLQCAAIGSRLLLTGRDAL